MNEMKTNLDDVKHQFVGQILKTGKSASFQDCWNYVLQNTEIYIRDYKAVKNEMEKTFKDLTVSREPTKNHTL